MLGVEKRNMLGLLGSGQLARAGKGVNMPGLRR
jgi:hypothetical protein